jgi:hypothetical protein
MTSGITNRLRPRGWLFEDMRTKQVAVAALLAAAAAMVVVSVISVSDRSSLLGEVYEMVPMGRVAAPRGTMLGSADPLHLPACCTAVWRVILIVKVPQVSGYWGLG